MEVTLPECREPNHRIALECENDVVRIRANREGMVTLARLFLFLTQPSCAPGAEVDLRHAGVVSTPGTLNLIVEREG